MLLQKDLSSENAVFQPTGRFDAHEAPKFLREFDEIVSEGATVVHVDLSKVIFIDSTALAELVRAHRTMERAGGSFRLVAPSDPARVILEMTGLSSFFIIENPR